VFGEETNPLLFLFRGVRRLPEGGNSLLKESCVPSSRRDRVKNYGTARRVLLLIEALEGRVKPHKIKGGLPDCFGGGEKRD